MALASTGAGLLLLAVGVAAALRGPRWPGLGRRYERPAPPVPRPNRRAAGPDVDDTDLWRAQDRGDDPTR